MSYRILELNPQLAPFEGDIKLRMDLYHNTVYSNVCGQRSHMSCTRLSRIMDKSLTYEGLNDQK